MGTGRPPLPKRLERHFSCLYFFEYDDETIKHVFSSVLLYCMGDYPNNIRALIDNVVNAGAELYKNVAKEFPPLPKKAHYQFNLRDLSKTFQGITSVNKEFWENCTEHLRGN